MKFKKKKKKNTNKSKKTKQTNWLGICFSKQILEISVGIVTHFQSSHSKVGRATTTWYWNGLEWNNQHLCILVHNDKCFQKHNNHERTEDRSKHHKVYCDKEWLQKMYCLERAMWCYIDHNHHVILCAVNQQFAIHPKSSDCTTWGGLIIFKFLWCS